MTRSAVATTVLTAALVPHISLGLHNLASRRTLPLPLRGAADPHRAGDPPFLLLPHIVNTRIAWAFFGVNDTYLCELARLWPDRAVLRSPRRKCSSPLHEFRPAKINPVLVITSA
jgi:adenylate cyclase